LGNWVHYIRGLYNLGKLDDELRVAVEEIGLKWTHWEKMYAEFKKYKEQYGTSNVPRKKNADGSYDDYNTLSRWVVTQRNNYKAGKMSQQEIAMMEELDFDWNPPRLQTQTTPGAKKEQPSEKKKSFAERRSEYIDELRAFKAEHGHVNLGQKDGFLGRFIHRMRREYKLGTLDLDTIRQLNEIGMDWSVWDMMYDRLKAFYESNGHTHVPRKLDNTLARWLDTQRRKYKHGVLSEDRITKLNELQMIWVLEKQIFNGVVVKSHSEKLEEYKEQLRVIKEAKSRRVKDADDLSEKALAHEETEDVDKTQKGDVNQ
jgi:hypothetical protein